MFFLHYEQINDDDDDDDDDGALLCGFNVAIKRLTHKLLGYLFAHAARRIRSKPPNITPFITTMTHLTSLSIISIFDAPQYQHNPTVSTSSLAVEGTAFIGTQPIKPKELTIKVSVYLKSLT